MLHRVLRLGVATLALLQVVACGSRGEPTASDDTIRTRVVEYFGKAVETPGVSFTVKTLGPAEVPGWRTGVVQAELGGQTQDIPIWVSGDGRFLFRGEAIDLTIDPAVALMRKIKLEGEPSRGPADAKVTVVEYSDFECPYCARAWEIFEKEVYPGYRDKVRFVFKQMPLTQIHPWAEDAAIATECALEQGNDAFWKLYDGLFAAQAQITKDNVADKVEALATAGGLDAPRLRECLTSRKTVAAVRADQSEAMSVGVNSTPTFFVNGRRVQGAQSPEAFKQAIDQALASAGS